MTTHSEQTSTATIDKLRSGPTTLSVGQVATYLGVSRAYGYEIAREGRLPVIKLGSRRVRVPTAALIKMLGAEV